ncbi:MAG: HAD family phosphatase [Erysipelotrichaceae bacterium]|nr:HAD family phosphatase [Erysipelotrichaceae bacterium]
MIRLIASDLDGTLLKNDGTISAKTLETIRLLNRQGILFTVASGRDFTGVHGLFAPLHVSYEAILANGAEYIDQSGFLVSTCYLDKSLVKGILSVFDSYKVPSMMFTTAGVCTHMKEKEGRERYRQRMICRQHYRSEDIDDPKLAATIPALSMTGVRYLDALHKSDTEILKLECFDMNKDEMALVEKELRKFPDIVFFSSAGDNFEITDRHATKGEILKRQCEEKGIGTDEVLVIGDGLNDLSMFELFPHSACMANGMELLKEKAEWIVPAGEEKGFTAAVRHFVDLT